MASTTATVSDQCVLAGHIRSGSRCASNVTRRLSAPPRVGSGFRYYTPSLGRWINRDPIEELGGENVHLFSENAPIDSFDVLGRWHTSVHRDMTITWAFMESFNVTYAAVLGFEDDRVDEFPRSSLPVLGRQDRHMLYRWGASGDSRTEWFNRERTRAEDLLTEAAETQNPRLCLQAAVHFGRGLHSLQDRSAHRAWPEGGDWRPLRIHPSWWDAWTDDEFGLQWWDEWWNDHGHEWGRDYLPWYEDPQQVASQQRARAAVERESLAALRDFAVRVRDNCVCRPLMLQ